MKKTIAIVFITVFALTSSQAFAAPSDKALEKANPNASFNRTDENGDMQKPAKPNVNKKEKEEETE